MKRLLTLLAAPVLVSSAPPPQHTADAGQPPIEYWGENVAITVYSNNPGQTCPGRVTSGEDSVVLGCTYITDSGVPIIVLPNPCLFDMETEFFALIACHEKGHLNGWPGHHPR